MNKRIGKPAIGKRNHNKGERGGGESKTQQEIILIIMFCLPFEFM